MIKPVELFLRNKKAFNDSNEKFQQKLNFDSDSDQSELSDDKNYDVMTFLKLKQINFQFCQV